MLFRARRFFNKRRFAHQARQIFDTPPLKRREAPLAILTMVQHMDLAMYLLAIKSFYRRIGEGAIIVVDDGSLTDADKRSLEYHLDGPEFRESVDVDTRPCPDYISWRRLHHVIHESRDRYVIQMDSDTVTLDDVPELLACRDANRAFILGSLSGQDFAAPREIAARARESNSDHVQVHAERSLAEFPDAGSLRYIRGSAGFAGFPKGALSWPDVEAFSRQMEARIGREKWREWGSEQVTTNFLIANTPDPSVLRTPKYTNHSDNTDIWQAAFVHFIGTWRFHGGRYAACARRAIKDM